MQEYRAYLVDESGKVSQATIFVREDTDEAAIDAAKRLLTIAIIAKLK